MPIYLVGCRMDTYATAEIEAANEAEAILIAKGIGPTDAVENVEWDCETDWDSSTDFKIGD